MARPPSINVRPGLVSSPNPAGLAPGRTTAAPRSAESWTTRIPLPPPPAVAFTRTGYATARSELSPSASAMPPADGDDELVGRDDGDAGGSGDAPGVVLATHNVHHVGGRAHEDQSGVRHRAATPTRSDESRSRGGPPRRRSPGRRAAERRRPGTTPRPVWGRVAPCRRRRAHAERPGRRPTSTATVRIPAAEAARMTRSAISPRLATSREPKGLACKEKVMASHPEDAVGRFR